MDFGSIENLSHDQNLPRSTEASGIGSRIIAIVKNMSSETKKTILPIVLAVAGAATLPFIAGSDKPVSSAQKNFTARAESMKGFETGENRTPYMDIQNYYVLLKDAERVAQEKKTSLKDVFDEKDSGAYEAFKKSVKKQAVAARADITSNSSVLNPNLSEQQQLLVEESRGDPRKTVEYTLYLYEKLGLSPDEDGLTSDFLAEQQRRKTEDQISSTR